MPIAHNIMRTSVDGTRVGGREALAGWRLRRSSLFYRCAALLVALAVGLCAAPAAAGGKIVWKRTKLEELDKSWKIAIEVHLDKAPDVAHMPVRFTFTALSYYERALVDGRKDPVIRQVPLEHQQPIVESVDVGFLDPGTGKTANRTRFTFQITRDRGFEAGTYEVQVTDARSGKELGGEATLTLDGENDVVDRRTMVFDDQKSKPKKSATETKAAASSERELTPEDDAYWAGGAKPPAEKESALPPPAHMRDKPGCGCRLAGQTSAAPGWALGALGLGSFVRRRRAARARATGT